MRFKTISVLLPAALFFLSEPAKADKHYEVSIHNQAKAGTIQLQPGDYILVLDDSKVRLRELKTGKEFEVAAEVDNSSEKKFKNTTIHSRLLDGTTLITEIRLGGTKTRVAFP